MGFVKVVSRKFNFNSIKGEKHTKTQMRMYIRALNWNIVITQTAFHPVFYPRPFAYLYFVMCPTKSCMFKKSLVSLQAKIRYFTSLHFCIYNGAGHKINAFLINLQKKI